MPDTNTNQLTDRLDRLEQKIDKLTDAMVTLARTEEKIMALESDRSNLTNRINTQSEKIDKLHDEVMNNSRFSSILGKGLWIIFAAIIGIALKVFFI